MPKQENYVEALVRQFPSVEESGAIAVSISNHLTGQEQAFFIAGFQECIKYLTARQSA
jgi:hypothetical protein